MPLAMGELTVNARDLVRGDRDDVVVVPRARLGELAHAGSWSQPERPRWTRRSLVVFRGVLGNRVSLADPAFGNHTMLASKFERAWLEFGEFGKVGFVRGATMLRRPIDFCGFVAFDYLLSIDQDEIGEPAEAEAGRMPTAVLLLH